MKKPIYYLPGHGGVLHKGLGTALLARGHEVMGRETVGEFNRLPFGQQVEVIAQDLTAHFAQSDAQVIANSFGAYLFMQAQAQISPLQAGCCCSHPSWVNLAAMKFAIRPS